jgi:hypothetical protein
MQKPNPLACSECFKTLWLDESSHSELGFAMSWKETLGPFHKVDAGRQPIPLWNMLWIFIDFGHNTATKSNVLLHEVWKCGTKAKSTMQKNQ